VITFSEMKKLQASVDLSPRMLLEQSLNRSWASPSRNCFESFDDKPLAAASLAQVHRAVYKSKQVVLKVQRLNITEITEADIEIMRSLAGLAERYYPALYSVNTVGLVNEFAEQMKKELDFRMEANNLRRFAQNFEGDDTIHVPEVYMDLCTRRVITMEFLDGINISDTKRLRDEGYNLQLIARRGAILGFRSTFEYGFFPC